MGTRLPASSVYKYYTNFDQLCVCIANLGGGTRLLVTDTLTFDWQPRGLSLSHGAYCGIQTSGQDGNRNPTRIQYCLLDVRPPLQTFFFVEAKPLGTGDSPDYPRTPSPRIDSEPRDRLRANIWLQSRSAETSVLRPLHMCAVLD